MKTERGTYYLGQWSDDNRQGFGYFIYKDQGFYVGEWNEDRRQGYG